MLENQFPMPFSWSLLDCHLKLSTCNYRSALHNNDSWHFMTISSSSLIFTLIPPQKKPLEREKTSPGSPPKKSQSDPWKKKTTKKHNILRWSVDGALKLFTTCRSIEIPTELHLEIHRWPFANRFLRWHPTRRWLSTWEATKKGDVATKIVPEKAQGGKLYA